MVPGPSHYTAIDEAGTDDTDYIWSNYNLGFHWDYFSLPNHTTQTGVITEVRVNARVWQFGFGTVTFKIRLKLTGLTEDYEYLVTDNLVKYNISSALSKPGGGTWTWDNIDNLQLAVGIQVENVYEGYCSKAWVEVDFSTGRAWIIN